MESKGFFDVFKKYTPSVEKRKMLERATDAKFRYKKEPTMQVEVELTFASHEDSELIYEVEDECKSLYGASSFKIIPHFPPSEFNIDRFKEISCEAAMCGAITYGFLNDADISDDGTTITIKIPFYQGGIDFVKGSGTEAILSNILFSRYGVRRNINVVSGDNADDFYKNMERHREDILAKVEQENAERSKKERLEALARKEEEARLSDPHYDFASRAGISLATGANRVISDTEYKMGASIYVTNDCSHIFGDDFEVIEPTPLSEIESIRNNSVFLGTIFELTSKETRGGTSFTCTIGISDGACATYIRKFQKPEEMDWFKELKCGTHVAVIGKVKRDKFDNEAYIEPRGIKKISKKERMDDAEKKRVELHLHTNMSTMDAIITPADLVNTAIRWGHSAIAVTDHGNVQAFPEVMLALEKARKSGKDLKVLYGMEAVIYFNMNEFFLRRISRCLVTEK